MRWIETGRSGVPNSMKVKRWKEGALLSHQSSYLNKVMQTATCLRLWPPWSLLSSFPEFCGLLPLALCKKLLLNQYGLLGFDVEMMAIKQCRSYLQFLSDINPYCACCQWILDLIIFGKHFGCTGWPVPVRMMLVHVCNIDIFICLLALDP